MSLRPRAASAPAPAPAPATATASLRLRLRRLGLGLGLGLPRHLSSSPASSQTASIASVSHSLCDCKSLALRETAMQILTAKAVRPGRPAAEKNCSELHINSIQDTWTSPHPGLAPPLVPGMPWACSLPRPTRLRRGPPRARPMCRFTAQSLAHALVSHLHTIVLQIPLKPHLAHVLPRGGTGNINAHGR